MENNMIGRSLGNRYEILSQIGEGGMAIVYKAKCNVLNRLVAIKVLKDEFINDEEFIEKFKNEALSAGGLNQQNIISIYDVSEDNGVPYIVMEYVDGGNIKDIIHRQGKIDKDTMLDHSKQIALALREAHHHKIVHRDIKSQNIMITKNNMVKVADFGIAKAVTSSTITAVGTIMGSVHYFSPEQARGGYIDERSDIYSMGIVMYEMITGKLPFEGDSPVSIALKHIQEEIRFDDDDDIPSEIKDLIRKATQKSPDRRYKKIEDLIDDIEYVKNSRAVALGMGFEDETYRTQVIHADDDDYKILFTDLAEESGNEVKKNKRSKIKNSNEERLSKKSYFFIALIALLSSLLFVSAIFLFKGTPVGDPVTKKVETPNFLGKTEKEAEELANSSGLTIKIVGTEVNVNYEPGQVSKQEPQHGTKLDNGSEVRLTISQEKVQEKIRMPRVEGLTIEEARKDLEEKDLKVIVEYRSDAKPENEVISQTPVEGYELEKGASVKLVVSSGIDQSQVSVPKITGKTIDDAKATLTSAKLRATVSYRENKDQEEGIVLSQNPKEGTKVEVDSEIAIVVNRYEKPALRSVPIVLTLGQDRDSIKIEIIDIQTGEVVVNQTVDPIEQGGTVAVNVQGESGQVKEYYVYLDGDRTTIFAKPIVNF